MRKRIFTLIGLLIFTVVHAAPTGAFESLKDWNLAKAEQRQQTLSQQPLPGSSEQAIKITWDATVFQYAELHLTSPRLLPPEFQKGTIALQLWLPARAPIRSISLRLVDAKGETFQFQSRYLPQSEDKLHLLEYSVDLAQRYSASWGGNNDKILDQPVRLLGFSIDFERESDVGEAYFAGLDIRSRKKSIADNIRLEVETGNPIPVLRPGEEEKLKLVLRNTGNEPFAGEAVAEFEDFSGKILTETLPKLNLAAGESLSMPVKTAFPSFGHWSVRVRLSADEQEPTTLNRSFAYFVPAGPTPGRAVGFLWGISSHPQLHPAEAQKREALAAALVGAKVVREDVFWRWVQPARDQWSFRSFDQVVDIFAEQGIEIQAILCYCAPWAAADQNSPRRDIAEPEAEAWKTFCAEMAKRYRGKIRYWEVWNEPDVSPFSQINSTSYAQMMHNAYQVIKKVNPDAVVLTGGFATLANHPMLLEPNYQEQSLRKGKGAFDIHAYHEHGPFYPHFARMVDERFLPMRERAGVTEPWWANETALTSAGGNERPQAMALYKKLLFSWARGAIGYNWYDLRNDGDDPNHGEHNYGMMTRDFYPKPVYAAYNALTTLFNGKEFVRQLEAGPLDWLLLFRDRNEMVLAAWNETETLLPLILRTDAKEAETVDLMGNRTPVTIHDGRILLEVGTTPVSLRLMGATKTELAGKLIQPENADIAVPGQTCRFALRLTNPLAEAAEFQLNFHAPVGMTPQKSVKTVVIPAGESRVLSQELRVDESYRPIFGTATYITVDYRITDRYQGKVAMPLRVAQVVPFAGAPNRNADFFLNRRHQVYELNSTDPTKAHQLWKGPRDLSGQVWLSTDGKSLNLRLSVSDDVHHQPQQKADVWMGDNVQLGIELPGQNGNWELGLTHLANGAPEVWCWAAPDGWDRSKSAAQIRLQTSRKDTETVYEAVIPFPAIGLAPEMLKDGFRFNLLINDNDGEGRKGWISISPGIGEEKDTRKFPFVIFR